MANFYVVCKDCEKKLQRKLKREKRAQTTQEFEELVLFETEHSISASPEDIADAMVCPRCNSSNCEKSFYGYNTLSYIRGNGYLDRAGCQRDMHLHHLTTNDPYGEMRTPGEVDDLKVKIKRAGQHNPKPKHFVSNDEMQKAVHTAVTTTE